MTNEGDNVSVQMTVGPDGQLVIPIALRQQAGIKAGDLVTLRYEGNGMLLLERREMDTSKAVAALVDAVNKIVEAEGWLKDAMDYAPALTLEMTRLIQVLHQAGIEAIEAKRTLKEKEN